MINLRIKKNRINEKLQPLCEKYGIVAETYLHKDKIYLNLLSGPIDFLTNYGINTGYDTNIKYLTISDVDYKQNYSGIALIFLDEVFEIMNTGNIKYNGNLEREWFPFVQLGIKYEKTYILTK